MILIKPVRAWELLDGQLKPDDFKNDNNRYIYERMLKVRDSGADVDFVTLAEKIDATRMGIEGYIKAFEGEKHGK